VTLNAATPVSFVPSLCKAHTDAVAFVSCALLSAVAEIYTLLILFWECLCGPHNTRHSPSRPGFREIR
jgi:hypothetical protein